MDTIFRLYYLYSRPCNLMVCCSITILYYQEEAILGGGVKGINSDINLSLYLYSYTLVYIGTLSKNA